MSRLLALFVALLGLLCLACGGSEGGENPGKALAQVGYGPADTWHLESPDLVDEMAEAGMLYVITEHFPTVQEYEGRDWRKGQVLASYPELAREWNKRACRNGQVHIVFGINENVVPHRNQPDSWAREQYEEMARTYDPACTILEPVVEPDEDLAKAARWTRMAAEIWPGKILMPVSHGDVPRIADVRYDLLDRHPGSIREAEMWIDRAVPGLLVITDGPPLLDTASTGHLYPALASRALKSGASLIFYTDRSRVDHGHFIRAIGAAIGTH